MRITTLLLGLTLVAGLAFAQDDGERQRHRGPRLDALQETLGLADGQLQALRENSAAQRRAMREAMAGTRENREALRNEMRQDDPNEAVIAEHLAAMSEARKQLESIRAQYRDSALAVLDENQKAALAEIQEAVELARLAPGAVALNLLEAPKGRRGESFAGPGGRRFGHREGPRGPRGPHGPQGDAAPEGQ